MTRLSPITQILPLLLHTKTHQYHDMNNSSNNVLTVVSHSYQSRVTF